MIVYANIYRYIGYMRVYEIYGGMSGYMKVYFPTPPSLLSSLFSLVLSSLSLPQLPFSLPQDVRTGPDLIKDWTGFQERDWVYIHKTPKKDKSQKRSRY